MSGETRTWPVTVLHTEQHIVWAEGETADEAATYVNHAPREWTTGETFVDGGTTVEAATGYDFAHFAYDGYTDYGPWAADRDQYYGAKPNVQVAS